MHPQAALFFKSALRIEAVPLSFLNPQSQKEVEQADGLEHAQLVSLLTRKPALHAMHYSWLAKYLQSCNTSERHLFLNVLSKKQQEKLAPQIAETKNPFSPFATHYAFHRLLELVFPKDLLAPEYFLSTPYGFLLEYTKPELVLIIDLLGIYDLAADLRHIVDKLIVQKAQEALGKEQLALLQYALKQPTKWVSSKLNLEGWDGTKQTLQNLLHKRGLVRFSLALHEEHADFKWHIAHRLDSGRGEILMQLFEAKAEQTSIQTCKQQLLYLGKTVGKKG